MTGAAAYIQKTVQHLQLVSEPCGGGWHQIDPAYGWGTFRICLCENDLSLILIDGELRKPIYLAPNKSNELYITSFSSISGHRILRPGDDTLPMRFDVINISVGGGPVRRTVFDPDFRLSGYLLVVDMNSYSGYLDRALGTSGSRNLLAKLPLLDQQVSGSSTGSFSRDLFQFAGDELSSRIFYRGKAAELLSRLLAKHPDHCKDDSQAFAGASAREHAEEVGRVAAYMSSHLGEPLTANDLARLFSSSPSRLSGMFKKVMHKSISEYRNDLKINEARCLLMETTLSQAEIAAKLGFSRASNFSDFYRRMTGEAPGALRKSRKQATL